MINKVDKKTLMDAIDYLFVEGFIEEMNFDQRHYVRALLNKVANSYKIKLEWDSE
tara:strand:- start:373 stop:537 length:165 start_codon:yes stop_codon:yes gene_type:complete